MTRAKHRIPISRRVTGGSDPQNDVPEETEESEERWDDETRPSVPSKIREAEENS